jgi:hypothetical protein
MAEHFKQRPRRIESLLEDMVKEGDLIVEIEDDDDEKDYTLSPMVYLRLIDMLSSQGRLPPHPSGDDSLWGGSFGMGEDEEFDEYDEDDDEF